MAEAIKEPYPNPRHDCIALGPNVIIPKVIRQTEPGVYRYWGYRCPMCNMGREFTDAEREHFEEHGYEEADNG